MPASSPSCRRKCPTSPDGAALESSAEDRLPRVVLERAAIPDLLGEGIPRGDGAAASPAAYGGAPLRRFARRHRLLPAAPRRGDVAPEGALRRADLLPRVPRAAG